MKKLLQQLYLFIQGFLLIHLFWYFCYLFLKTTVIPSPILVYQNFSKVVESQIFLHILYSLKRIAVGVFLSLLVGIPLGILMGYSKKANKILYPLVYFSYPIPKTALLPIAMLLWGMRDGSKIVIIFLIIVFQVIIAVRDSVKNIDSSLYLVTISAGASKIEIVRHVTLPAILPELLTSLRVSIGTAVSVLFFVEGYGTRYGMGYYIVDAWSRIDYIGMYQGIIIISIVGFILFASMDLLAEKLCVWK
ncbi:ABC transporter permease [Candidatus Galacturonibacter soehngenii]|uniref:ABC transporter permease n=1 Tax=Candidatus Galacturonatibacter soehngenii TaxID=2307010 RepID=A0A7V7QJ36_9FIRM|nr:ABC transporter permease [Candidatus Galacturonibacter soehngenii]KAB1435991.1 ABC transporter permease [Candidatus Galacturonibacter soehngenii]